MAQDSYGTPGTYTWSCPAGVTAVYVECWGSGGNGYGLQGVGSPGGGGGGYARVSSYPVTPGVNYTVIVDSYGNEGASMFNDNVSAGSGKNATSSTPGAGGLFISGLSGSHGGSGASGASGNGGGGGGAAGPAGNGGNASGITGGAGGGIGSGPSLPGGAGGNGSTLSFLDGSDGSKPGGGGGGGETGGPQYHGFDGAVYITYKPISSNIKSPSGGVGYFGGLCF